MVAVGLCLLPDEIIAGVAQGVEPLVAEGSPGGLSLIGMGRPGVEPGTLALRGPCSAS